MVVLLVRLSIKLQIRGNVVLGETIWHLVPQILSTALVVQLTEVVVQERSIGLIRRLLVALPHRGIVQVQMEDEQVLLVNIPMRRVLTVPTPSPELLPVRVLQHLQLIHPIHS